MNKEKEQEAELIKEEEGVLILEKTDELINSGCDVNADRCLSEPEKVDEFLKSIKKRDTSFVDARKKQIELYGNYYPAGLSDEKLLEWILVENNKLQAYLGNLAVLESDIETKIESDVNEKLAAFANSLSPNAKEKLKLIIA